MSMKRLMRLKLKMKQKKPDFKRQEWYKCKRIGISWRKPRGLHSGMRKQLKHRPAIVKVGYRSPSQVRGLHPCGLEDVLVHNLKELESLNPETQGARISATVGRRKKILMIKRAEELGIKILNLSEEKIEELLTEKVRVVKKEIEENNEKNDEEESGEESNGVEEEGEEE